MSAPCINDTCSITSLIDPVTRRLELNARIDPTGGLQCIDGRGLGLEILGAPVAASAIDECFQQLGITPAGEVWSIPKRARFVDFSGGPVNIPQGENEGDFSSDAIGAIDVTNPYDCSAMLLVIGRFDIGYTIGIGATTPSGTHGHPTVERADEAGELTPFNAEIRTRLEIDGSTDIAASVVPIGGVVPSALNGSHKRDWRYFAVRTTISGGQTRTLRAYANHEGNNEAVNISTVNPASAPAFAQRGFMARGSAIILPFNQQAL